MSLFLSSPGNRTQASLDMDFKIRDELGMKIFRYVAIVLVLFVTIFVSVNLYPNPLFSHEFKHSQFTIRSDLPIDEASWRVVIEDAERRLQTSDIDEAAASFRVFLCNEDWRLGFFTRNPSVGGFTDTFVSRNIYIRESVASENRIIPPSGTLADADVRPLSYFLAHEAVHVMQSRKFGRSVSLRSPRWLVEGHADLIAKAGSFDISKNRELLIENDAIMQKAYARNGLYRRYHLFVEEAKLMTGLSAQELYASPPSEQEILFSLKEKYHPTK